MGDNWWSNGISAYHTYTILLLIMALIPFMVAADTMFRVNSEHTCVYDNFGIAPTNTELWRFATGERVFSSPAVSNGVVYSGGNDNNLYAVGGIPLPPRTALTTVPVQAEKPFIRIDPIGDKHVCDKFQITAHTNLAVDDEVLVQVYSSSFKPNQKSQSGEFSGATGMVRVTKDTVDMNKLLFDLDTCTFKPDEYIVTEEALNQQVTNTVLFNVLGGATSTVVPTVAKTTVAPTTAVPTIPSTHSIDGNDKGTTISNSVPIWDRNNMIFVVLLVFVLLVGPILYDVYYKKKR